MKVLHLRSLAHLLNIPCIMESPPAPPRNDHRADSRAEFSELRAAVEELKRCCAGIPDCDSTGKLRGKIGRIEHALREAEADGDLTSVRMETKSLEQSARQILEIEPLTQLVQCANRLSEQLASRNGQA